MRATALCTRFVLLGLAVVVSVSPARAGQAPAATAPLLKVVTHHAIDVGGKRIAYDATVEETFSLDGTGQGAASIVSISYVRTDVGDPAARPVVFAFNGGPGSSSVWLHLGALGPRRVSFQDEVSEEEVRPKTTPPFRLADNPDSPLDVADIVLFDPPGTGLSRVLPGADERQFYGVEPDARVTSEFIQGWLTRNGRWNSPRFLVGESYGSIRAAVVARRLAGGPTSSGRMDGVTLNGVILLGQSMNMGGGSPEIAAAIALPALAATAWHHGRVSREGVTIDNHVETARRFAAGELLPALFAGSRLAAADRERVAERLSALTGLPADAILRHGLRIDARFFASELLKAEGRRLGLYDGRFTLPLSPSGSDPVADDPAMGQYVPPFVGAFEEYLRGELGVKAGPAYNAIEFAAVNFRWDYGSSREFAGDLAVAMSRNPRLRLFVGAGYFDLVTTIGSAEYTIAQAGIDPGRVTWRTYASGHMPYIGVASRRALAKDLREFITAAK